MQDEKLFLASRYANFYLVSTAPQETKFLVEPKFKEVKGYMERMNGALNLMEQHRKLQQHKTEKFIPWVVEFNAETGRLIMAISAELASAVPTLVVAHSDIAIDCRHAEWLTKQAFQLASSAYEAGIVLPFSVENFLVCYQGECFAMLDWTMAQVNCDKMHPIDAEVARAQVTDLAILLLKIVDYCGIVSDKASLNPRLLRFMREASLGAFLSPTEAMKVLNSLLG